MTAILVTFVSASTPILPAAVTTIVVPIVVKDHSPSKTPRFPAPFLPWKKDVVNRCLESDERLDLLDLLSLLDQQSSTEARSAFHHSTREAYV